MTIETVDVTITYMIFDRGAYWAVERQAESIQGLGRAMTKEQALRVANADANHWPACRRKVMSVTQEGVVTLEAVHSPA